MRLKLAYVVLLSGPALWAQKAEFNRDVAPLLQRCQGCHGPQQQMGGLRLDSRETAMQGGNSGALLEKGKSGSSRLVFYLTGQKGVLNPKGIQMPMGGQPFTEKELGIVRAWIDSGADWPGAPDTAKVVGPNGKPLPWSFQPILRPAVPAVQNRKWVVNPIDAFVLSRLEAEKVAPSPEANKTTLLRRLSLDLTGLLPTPAELEQFLSDTSPDAYEHLVDRLLASPHFGEKWARSWLDQARYADSEGHELDRDRPFGWRYRDWVIESLNRDQRFDQFTVEQIAGDLLPNRTTEQWIATGFHRNNLTDREGATEPALSQFETLVDRTNAAANAWLGISVGCAQCHNHKFDPITQKEYYQFMAFFNTFKEIDIDAPLPGELGPHLRSQAEYLQKRDEILKQYKVAELQAEWEKGLQEANQNPGKRGDWDIHWLRYQVYVDNGKEILQTPAEKRSRKDAEAVTDFFVKRSAEVYGKHYAELKLPDAARLLDQLKTKYPQLSQAPVITEVTTPRKNNIHLGGEYDALGVAVEPGTPAALPPLPAVSGPSRMALAKWMVGTDNPLVRRVAVNRLWQELFGRGLVRTSEDLGTQGTPPTHPELLDWLAVEFSDRGWSRKQIIREIVTSATYRQASNARPDLADRDPENALLARQSRTRLPAEGIRDVALESSGLLNDTIGGPSVRPYLPPGSENSYPGSQRWRESEGRDKYRRGLYTYFKRSSPYPSLINFDAPNANMSVCRRTISDTPLQSLDLLNDPVFFEAAQALAVRVIRESPGGKFSDRLKYAFLLTVNRPPEAREEEQLLGFFQQQKNLLSKDLKASSSEFPFDLESADRIEGAAWVNLGSVLLNLDEFITKE